MKPAAIVRFGVAAAFLAALSCTGKKEIDFGTQSFRIGVTGVNGTDPPSESAPLPANTGKTNEEWDIAVEAVGPDGKAIDFDGLVRVSVQPGAVLGVTSASGEALGRNLRLERGKATARVTVTAVYGEARLWIEDLGYEPAEPGKTPKCANGKNDDEDEDILVDFPNDPGCAFADDDSETASQFAAGVSGPVHYALPSVQDVQGGGSVTPYPFEAIQVNTSGAHELVVTRVAKDGFYVTDLSGQASGYNHLFAFNFSTPRNMRVCDRVVYLSGTVAEFFGFTELSFPSFEVDPLFEGEEDLCRVPEPSVLGFETIEDAIAMEQRESGLARVEGFAIPANFGPKAAINNVFGPDQSSCDLNGDGRVDFESEAESACANACSTDPECTEWTSFISRGNYKVWKIEEEIVEGSPPVPHLLFMQVQTDGASGFNPVAHRGATNPNLDPADPKAREILTVTGTLRNFSGGDLNWTIEARCTDDVVCPLPGCATEQKPPNAACVTLRTEDDNEEGTN